MVINQFTKTINAISLVRKSYPLSLHLYIFPQIPTTSDIIVYEYFLLVLRRGFLITCSNCQNQQSDGVFCQKCGNRLDNSSSQSMEEIAASTSTNHSSGLENVKHHTQSYIDFFLTMSSNPNNAFNKERTSFIYGFISLLILSISASLGMYLLLNGLYKDSFSYMYDNSSLPFEVFFRLFFSSTFIILAGLFALTIILKISRVDVSFDSIADQYGSLSTPFAAISLLTIISGLSGSIGMTTTFAVLSISAFVTVVPILLSYHYLSKAKLNQSVYLTIGCYFINLLIVYMMYKLFLGDILEQIYYLA